MKTQKTPFKCHIFVCVNDRHGASKSCADNGSKEIRLSLKQTLKIRGIEGVRVSQSLCLGVCEQGPNIMLYPQGVWFSDVKIEDVNSIIKEVIKITEC